jgi:hypothetical protein
VSFLDCFAAFENADRGVGNRLSLGVGELAGNAAAGGEPDSNSYRQGCQETLEYGTRSAGHNVTKVKFVLLDDGNTNAQ